jgi:hypothetical protein
LLGGDDYRSVQTTRLSRQDHIAIEAGIGCHWVPEVSSLGPEIGCLSHRAGRDGQVLKLACISVKVCKRNAASRADQFSPHFVIGNFWKDNAAARSDETREPPPAGLDMSWFLWMTKNAKRRGVEHDDGTHLGSSIAGSG